MFKKWYEKALLVGPDERSDLLKNDEGMANSHTHCAQAGETTMSHNVEHHFICYVNFNSTLYEVGKSRFENIFYNIKYIKIHEWSFLVLVALQAI